MSPATVKEVLANLRLAVIDHGRGEISAYGAGARVTLHQEKSGAWRVHVRHARAAESATLHATDARQLEQRLQLSLGLAPAGSR